MLSAPAHLGEVRLKSVQDILGICGAEPLFYKLSKMPTEKRQGFIEEGLEDIYLHETLFLEEGKEIVSRDQYNQMLAGATASEKPLVRCLEFLNSKKSEAIW